MGLKIRQHIKTGGISMKRLLAILLCLVMAISLAACTPAAVTPAETEAPAEPEAPAATEAPAEPEAPAAEGLTMETVKVGFIHISDNYN
jgi:glucose/arabinose dehydrogenase